MKTTTTPNPDRVYAAIAKILERRHSVKIQYTLKPKSYGGESYEQQNCN